MAVDQYFTPAKLAAAMLSSFRSRHERLVADFAAGNGDLLGAARNRWPACGIIATDVDESRVRFLRRTQDGWLVGKCDFLNASSRARSAILSHAKGSVSLVLLNPPFSCRGNERISVALAGQEILCSRAMAFVLNSIPYLAPSGRLAAILPAGSLTSQKDARAWKFLRRLFNVKVLSSHGLRTFEGCAARTTVVCLSRLRPGAGRKRSLRRKQSTGIAVVVVRGVLPVYEAMNGLAGRGWPFLHTTNLRESAITDLDRSVTVLRRYAMGPAVLIPRVGLPDNEKCVLYLARKRLVLSDCLFAIKCNSSDDARRVYERLLASWDVARESYSGTCAKYLTTDRLRELLGRLGFEISG